MNTLKIKTNPEGRLFFTTDIHGELPTLLHALRVLSFEETLDTLVCCGDLIDRGRYNKETAEWFLEKHHNTESGVYTVLGNHCVFSFENNKLSRDNLWIYNGGSWAFSEMTAPERRSFGLDMKTLPYAIEVEHKDKKIGVVHAAVSNEYQTWDNFLVALEDNNPYTKQAAVWDRCFVEYKDYEEYQKPLEGVDLLVHGHTPVKAPLKVGNRLHIDTALVYGKYLTVYEIDKEEFHSFDLVDKEK